MCIRDRGVQSASHLGQHKGAMIDESSIEATMGEKVAAREIAQGPLVAAPAANRIAWLIDNAEAYASLLASLRGARRSVHIAQLAFDADYAACVGDSRSHSLASEAVLAEALIELAASGGPEIRILLNATWILDTARPLRKFFRKRGVPPQCIEVRGMRRFPNFMHAKMVIVDGACLLYTSD